MAHAEFGDAGDSGRAVILLYHRVAVTPCDPQSLCVAPHRFEQHLKVIRECARPIGMCELSRAVSERSVPGRSVAVTFDDGYADNLHAAAPLLAGYGVPGTVFVTTGEGDREDEFWWDALEAILLGHDSLPESLELEIAGRSYAWDLGDEMTGSTASAESTGAGSAVTCVRRTPVRWNVLDSRRPTRREAAYLELCTLLRPLMAGQREAALDRLRSWSGISSVARPTHRRLNDEELRTLAHCPGIKIGAHTVTHPVLSAIPASEQRREISESRDRLARTIGRPIAGFSYPFGQRRDYTDETINLVREAGFSYACANSPGSVGGQTDRYRMPRHLVRDWDADTFALRLHEWLDG